MSLSSTKFAEGGMKLARLGRPIAHACVYLLFFLLPLFFLPWTSEVFEMNKQVLLIAGVSVGLLAWLGGMVLHKKVSLRLGWMFALAFGFLASLIVSAALSSGGFVSWVGQGGQEYQSFLTAVAFVLAFVLLAHVGTDAVVQRRALAALSGSAFVAGVLTILDSATGLRLPFGFAQGAGFNPIGTVNALTVFLVVAAMAGIAAFLVSDDDDEDLIAPGAKGVPMRILVVLNALLALYFLLVVDFWVLWLLVIVGILLLGTFLFVQAKRFPHPQRFILPLLLLAASVVFILPQIHSPISLPVPTVVSPTYGMSAGIAKSTLGESRMHFLFGSGPGTYAQDYGTFHPVEVNQTSFWDVSFDRAKSHLLTVLATYGVLPTLLALGLFGWILVASVMRLMRDRDREGWKTTFVLLTGFVVLLLEHALYSSNMTLSFLVWGIAGLLASQLLPPPKNVDFASSPRLGLLVSFAFVVVLVGVLSGILVTVQRYSADVAFAAAVRDDQAGKPLDQVVNELGVAVNRNPLSDLYLRNLSTALLLQASDAISKAGAKPSQQDISRIQQLVALSVSVSKRATDIAPDNASNWAVRGSIYRELLGFVDNAQNFAAASFQQAMALEPNNPAYVTDLGQVHLDVADRDRTLLNNKDATLAKQAQDGLDTEMKAAEDAFNKSLALKGDYAPAAYYLAVVYERENKLDQAAARLSALTVQNPLDVGLSVELGLLELRMNQTDKAVAELERAKSIAPDNSDVLWFLASAYEVAGRRADAIALVEQVQKLNPDNDLVKQRLSQMQAGVNTTILPQPVDSGTTSATQPPTGEPTTPPTTK
jgi:tetratricopeptide (TPR) repeat protein